MGRLQCTDPWIDRRPMTYHLQFNGVSQTLPPERMLPVGFPRLFRLFLFKQFFHVVKNVVPKKKKQVFKQGFKHVVPKKWFSSFSNTIFGDCQNSMCSLVTEHKDGKNHHFFLSICKSTTTHINMGHVSTANCEKWLGWVNPWTSPWDFIV